MTTTAPPASCPVCGRHNSDAARWYVCPYCSWEAPGARRSNGNGDQRTASDGANRQSKRDPADLFRRYTAGELAGADLTVRWTVKGVLIDPTYGMLAGEAKTLKTVIGTFLDVSIASGVPLFGRFEVPHPGPVLTFVGEGGRIPFTRRLLRIATAVGVELDNLPYHVSFDVAPIGSDRFASSLERDLADLSPRLVHLDPYYAFHGVDTDARNLHHEGELLAGLAATCADADASLWVTNHFNQTGTGRGLSRITMAGSAEWSDSWMLVAHRSTPDVANGRFRLLVEIGSRQWGGGSWDLDLDIGRFDPDSGFHDGDISWTITPHDSTADAEDAEAAAERAEEGKRATYETEVLAVLRRAKTPLNKTTIIERAEGTDREVRKALARLVEVGQVVAEDRPGGGGKRAQTVYKPGPLTGAAGRS